MRRAGSDMLVLCAVFAALVICNIALWSSVRPVKARWMNIPPAPSGISATGIGLGDAQIAYRVYGIMIQNFGDTGGRTTALKDYDYEALGTWLRLEHTLDPKSDYVPFLAAYVFGGSQDPQKLGPVIDYLAEAAGEGEGEKWRWLAQAVHLARFKMQDMPRAFALANKLAAMYRPGMPAWVLQMPAFVMTESGDKQAALGLMLEILQSSLGKIPQQETNAMIDYLCTRILDPHEAAQNKLCTENPLSP
jgi:hypothetical protein